MKSTDPVFTSAVKDLSNAMASRDAINPDLKMATNGWVRILLSAGDLAAVCAQPPCIWADS